MLHLTRLRLRTLEINYRWGKIVRYLGVVWCVSLHEETGSYEEREIEKGGLVSACHRRGQFLPPGCVQRYCISAVRVGEVFSPVSSKRRCI